MVFSIKNGSVKLVVIIFSLLVVLLVIHQLNAAGGFAFSGQLSESLQIIDRCSPNSPEISNHSDSVADLGLPNIIHQIWRTNDVRTYSTELEASRESWITMLKPLNYTVKLWTDDDVLKLLMANYTWLFSTYKSYPQNIQRADLARLVVVHAEGGIYADLDVYPRDARQTQCLQHLGLQAIFAPTTGTLGLSNHFFMAERESSFLLSTLDEAKRRGAAESRHFLLPYLRVFWTTGPMMVTAAFRDYVWLYGTQRQSLGLLDERYGQTVIRHAAGRSWHGSDGKVLNYVADHVRMRVPMSLFILIILFGLVCDVRKRCNKYRELLAYRCLSSTRQD
jgi:inositol phosphorylceramide mannosyltransferase catalytic subunit